MLCWSSVEKCSDILFHLKRPKASVFTSDRLSKYIVQNGNILLSTTISSSRYLCKMAHFFPHFLFSPEWKLLLFIFVANWQQQWEKPIFILEGRVKLLLDSNTEKTHDERYSTKKKSRWFHFHGCCNFSCYIHTHYMRLSIFIIMMIVYTLGPFTRLQICPAI